MFVAEHTSADGWIKHGMRPYGPLSMDPAAQVLNYGQSIFEGMKAQRTLDDEIVLFRPRDNAARMRAGADRMSMVSPPESLFLEAVTSTVRANSNMVPPAGKGALYLRPLLLGTGPIVGLGPAPSFTFLCFGAAVGRYFKVCLIPWWLPHPCAYHSTYQLC
jgi:branched-chain amino acid aminotransferase